MLTRIYLDNFRCFVKFEHRPARRELILGPNGSGKSSLLDALLTVRQFVIDEEDVLDRLLLQRTRWLDQRDMTCELEAELADGRFVYRLVIEPFGEPARPRVASETLFLEGKPIFEFTNGEVHLYNDQFEPGVVYPFDPSRSALATIAPRKENQKLSRFKLWLSGLLCFRINPFLILARAEGENLYPNVDLSNFAPWYRYLVQSDPQHNAALIASLREALDGFTFLPFEPVGENVRVLAAEFKTPAGASRRFYLNELSDGQRCLIALYTILHFVLANGGVVILDEPDNFISLREIQPWLIAAADMAEEKHAQVLIISHHPEIINQWAPENRVQLVRDASGAARIEPFPTDTNSSLTPAELIARGWDRG